jgi:hypothetical protein
MSDPIKYPELKYPWQKLVFEVFVEFDAALSGDKTKAAEYALLTRLRDPTPPDTDERTALNDALRALRVLFPHEVKSKPELSDEEVSE